MIIWHFVKLTTVIKKFNTKCKFLLFLGQCKIFFKGGFLLTANLATNELN